jgi:hypothetical protein
LRDRQPRQSGPIVENDDLWANANCGDPRKLRSRIVERGSTLLLHAAWA